jgi:hypothetical protein
MSEGRRGRGRGVQDIGGPSAVVARLYQGSNLPHH